MNKKEYKKYCQNVADFFEKEGITNLSHETGERSDGTNNGECSCCNKEIGFNDGYFTWVKCECCGSPFGVGTLVHANGYNPKAGKAYCYEVCNNCIYFSEYGRLDDLTMMDISKEDMEEIHAETNNN